jgi:hypothetical protein
MNGIICIPHEWAPRPHQMAAWKYLEAGGKRTVLVWHRRTGKDSAAGNWFAVTVSQHVSFSSHGLMEASRRQRLFVMA